MSASWQRSNACIKIVWLICNRQLDRFQSLALVFAKFHWGWVPFCCTLRSRFFIDEPIWTDRAIFLVSQAEPDRNFLLASRAELDQVDIVASRAEPELESFFLASRAGLVKFRFRAHHLSQPQTVLAYPFHITQHCVIDKTVTYCHSFLQSRRGCLLLRIVPPTSACRAPHRAAVPLSHNSSLRLQKNKFHIASNLQHKTFSTQEFLNTLRFCYEFLMRPA